MRRISFSAKNNNAASDKKAALLLMKGFINYSYDRLAFGQVG